ncbi:MULTISPECIES: hypothetical protein [Actinosynnema]|uniref:Uncharacterized protein n=1 Tax=Actinosynnema pretiosum TaxID=42197 RepID=A0A290ZB04_9PSEU|nr:hypothetical protein [Actinosynnema pretiosum]ATE56164.1 hypothetical protein CNX65_25180 [Actinosynnema pretiosum]MCP2098614.1 hypothetical protein [Actinosynnema pretiosum]
MTHYNRVTPGPVGGQEPRRSEVEIGQALDAAHRMSATAGPDDGPLAELGATYAALGELLEAWQRREVTDPQEFESQCADLAERLQALGAAQLRHAEQRAAAWTAAAVMPRRAGVR